MEYLMLGPVELIVILSVVALCSGLIFLYFFRFTKTTYPRKTQQLLNDLAELESIGLKRYDNRYEGKYRDFLVYIYATYSSIGSYPNNVYGGERYQVFLAVVATHDQLKNLSGFFGKYMVTGQQENFAYIGFMVNAMATADREGTTRARIDRLIDTLNEQGVRPFVA